jgi:acyl CoA:acetate/3-ketoacid CoA transferase
MADMRNQPVSSDAVERFLARRAMQEIRPHDVAVVGFGVCAAIPALMARSPGPRAALMIKQGAFGGTPLSGQQFGCAYNSSVLVGALRGTADIHESESGLRIQQEEPHAKFVSQG